MFIQWRRNRKPQLNMINTFDDKKKKIILTTFLLNIKKSEKYLY